MLQADLLAPVQPIAQSAIDVSHAVSELGVMKVICGIFVVFMIILIVLFVYQVFIITNKVNKVHEVSQRVEDYFNTTNDHSVGQAQADILISRSFNHLKALVKYQILKIRLENHIDDRVAVDRKVEMIVRNECNELKYFLSQFTLHGKDSLAELVNWSDQESIQAFMLEQIYIPKDEYSISQMEQATSIFINGLRLVTIRGI